MAIFFAISTAIQLVTKGLDKLIVTQDEANEQFKNSSREYKEAKTELESLNNELLTTNKRIIELENQPSLSFIEQEELENLKAASEELRQQIEYNKLLAEQKQTESRDNAIDYFGKKSNFKTGYEYDEDSLPNTLSRWFTENKQGKILSTTWTFGTPLEQAEAEVARYTQLQSDISNVQKEIADLELTAGYEQNGEWIKRTQELSAYEKELKRVKESLTSLYGSFIEKDDFLNLEIEDDKVIYDKIQALLIDMGEIGIGSVLGQSITDSFNEVWNSFDFKPQQDKLMELAKAGQLDTSILENNEEYASLLETVGGNANSAVLHINSLAQAEVDAAVAAKQAQSQLDFSSAFGNLPTNKLEEYIAIANDSGFNKNNIASFKELDKVLKETGVQYDDLNDLIKEWAENQGHISTSDLITGIQDSYSLVEDIKNAFNTTGQIGTDAIQSIAEKFPELQTVLAKYSQGLITAEELIESLELAYVNDLESYKYHMALKLAEDVNFYNNVLSNDTGLISALGDAYGDDAKNWASLAQAKKEIDEQLINELGQAWGDYFDIIIDANTGLVDIAATMSPVDENAEYLQAYAALNKMADARNRLFEAAKLNIVDPKADLLGDNKSTGSSSASKQFNQTFDFFERRIEVLTDAFENLGSTMDNVLSAKAKNALLSAQTDILTAEINDYTSALTMYGEKAEQSLSNLDESLVYKIKNGVNELTDFTGENGETIVKAMEAYRGWAEKVEDCKNRINELKKEIAQIELTKFNNIADQYTNKFDLYGNSVDLIDKQIGLFEAAGQLVGESFYEEQIQLTNNQLNTLRAQKKELAKQMQDAIRSGNVNKGSKEWLEMVDALNEVEGKILDSKTAVEEFENAILQIDWDTFDRVQTRFDNLNNELENLASLFDDMNEISVLDDDGNWTKEAVATLGLYAQQYELAQHRVKQYSEAIQQLQDDYNDGKYSATEYADKLADLNSGQWDAVKSAESLEDAIMSLNESRVDKEIESIQEAIEAYDEYTQSQIDALEAAKELHDYEESISEKTKSISKLEKQLAAMQNDNSAETIAKRKKLEEELAEARKDLENTEYDHSVDVQIKGLEDNNKSHEEKRQAEIEALQQSLKDRETIITQSFETVKQNANLVGQEIENIANAHGVNVSESLIESWKSGENAIASYGQTLTTKSSEFVQQLSIVEQKEYDLQEQANSTSESIAGIFGNKADSLVTEFDTATSKVNDMNLALTEVQNVLNSIAQNGIDTSAIVSSLEKVKDAAKSASAAIQDVGSDNSNKTEKSVKYKIVDAYSGEILAQNLDYSKAKQMVYAESDMIGKTMNIVRMKKGGIVGNKSSNLFEEYAKRIGEDRMIAVKDGEGILTKEQTQAFLKLVPTLNNFDRSWIKQPYIPDGFSSNKNNVSYNYDSILTVNGNIDDTNATKMTDLIRKELRSTFSKMDRDHRYSGY